MFRHSYVCRALPLLTVLLLAACGSPAAQAPSSAPSAATASAEQPAAAASEASATASQAAAGTRTIEHKYGSTTIEGIPERIVSVGFTDQDAVLALGVVPVGIRDWYGEQPYAVWPWAQDELGDAKPEVLQGEINFEQIAALQPDLIVGVSSGMTEEQYTTLSEIAPTLAQSGEYVDYGVPWQEQTRVIGQALGRQAEAEKLVADVEAQFAAARQQHPEWDGASALVAAYFNNEYGAYSAQDVRGRLLASLGFEVPAEINELAGESFYASISRERLDLLDTDALLWIVSTEAERQAIENDPLYQQLDVAKQGRAIFLDQQLSGAASFSSVLSLPYLLEELVPQLADATDGGS